MSALTFDQIRKAKEEGGIWRTIHGSPVFIQEGESLNEALTRRFGTKGKEGTVEFTLLSKDKVDAYMKQYSRAVYEKKGFSKDQLDTVNNYTGLYYAHINGYLDGSWKPGDDTIVGLDFSKQQVEEQVAALDKFTSQKIPEDMLVYRGMELSSSQLKRLKQTVDAGKEATLKHKGFVSTSMAKAGRGMGGMEYRNPVELAIRIEVPKGTRGGIVGNGLSRMKGDREVLLARNTSITITRIDYHKDEWGTPKATIWAQVKR